MKFQKLFPLIGIAIFLFILWNLDLNKIVESIQNIDPVMVILAIFVTIPAVLLKAFKWNILTKSCGISQSFTGSVSRWLVGFSIGIITPGRLGDLSRAYYLKSKAGLGIGLTTVVIDRLIDVIILFILTIAGLFFLITSYTIGNILLPISVLFITLLIMTLAFTRKGTVASILKPIFSKFIPERYKPRLGSLFREFYKGIHLMGKKKSLVLFSTLICIVAWAFSIFQYYMLSLSLGLDITYPFLFMIAPLAVLLDALPISFSGLGTRDAVFIYFFGLIGLAAESAVALSIMIFLVCYILTGLVGMLFWVRNPIKTNSKAEPTSST